jgi:hypothetical protein
MMTLAPCVKLVRAAAVWFVLTAAISGALAVAQDLSLLVSVATDPQSTEGEITSTDCNRHATAFYRYRVNEVLYTGSASRTPNCATLKSGELIQVFFSKKMPDRSELANPKASLLNAIIFMAIVSFFSSTAIVAFFLMRSS